MSEETNSKKMWTVYIKTIKESAKATNCEEILIPGEPELRTETERLRNGIPVVPATMKELAALGESLGISTSIVGTSFMKIRNSGPGIISIPVSAFRNS